ncbi:hypothetical protein [Angustibacter sp. Root456]|uniref:alginate O-acetyltransferase AlgX-related protein n=1 Tax=Angustibacter sp. Root456 TaxID=1736539 RepID=UPI0007018C8C|nr:hypothetical protein [Angustibacter sp. Root456]KQX69937.1 hypothetical protein ASD06_02765 [Angustibacter sp. Root456]
MGRAKAVIAVAAFGFVLAPVVAFALGGRATELENRELAPPPSASDGWKVFDRASEYTTDHLPLRPAAVRANEELTREVFRQPPDVATITTADGTQYPRVVVGEDGWLYYGGDFLNPCTARGPVKAPIDQLRRFTALLRASGRHVAVVVVPDKSDVAVEHLPHRYIGRVCAAERRRAFWQAYDAVDDPGFVDLRAPLRHAQREPGGTYLRSDSHWTALGQVIYAREVLQTIAPGVWDPEAVHQRGTFRKRGDLGPFVQAERVDVVPGYVIERPAVRLDAEAFPSSKHLSPRLRATARPESTGDPSRLVPGRTVLIGDSFTYNSVPGWQPWFSDITPYHRERSSRAQMVRAVAGADTVVLEVVERDAVAGRLMPGWGSFLKNLQSALAEQKK